MQSSRGAYTQNLSLSTLTLYIHTYMCVLWKCKSCNSVGLNIPDISNAIFFLFSSTIVIGINPDFFLLYYGIISVRLLFEVFRLSNENN
jgi:hypothetical protein